jgi:hypothetical protein
MCWLLVVVLVEVLVGVEQQHLQPLLHLEEVVEAEAEELNHGSPL